MPGKRKTELLETETAGGQTAEVAKELLETKTAEGERHASCEFETNEVEVEELEANLTLQAWFPPNRGSATPRFFKGSVLSDCTVHTGFHLEHALGLTVLDDLRLYRKQFLEKYCHNNDSKYVHWARFAQDIANSLNRNPSCRGTVVTVLDIRNQNKDPVAHLGGDLLGKLVGGVADVGGHVVTFVHKEGEVHVYDSMHRSTGRWILSGIDSRSRGKPVDMTRFKVMFTLLTHLFKQIWLATDSSLDSIISVIHYRYYFPKENLF
jgi:hypothetical protein